MDLPPTKRRRALGRLAASAVIGIILQVAIFFAHLIWVIEVAVFQGIPK